MTSQEPQSNTEHDAMEDTIDVGPDDPEATAVYAPADLAATSATQQEGSKSDEPIPEKIGRYAIKSVLGEGGFGRVYLAEDVELHRSVAVKVPHRHSQEAMSDLEGFMEEARILASLDHGHVVPVYDVGTTDDGLCYIVSKFIDGMSLRDWIRKDRPAYSKTARLLAGVSDALHYAHGRGIVHRDIKPDNILLDDDENPFLSDFGLALKNEQLGTGPGFVGTAYYMSPEQARGEGHLVDGRSDLFSLGVVLYLMITGERPFTGKSVSSIMRRILDDDPVHPRDVSREVPRELERICMKALAKRILDRYETAAELADELRGFAASATVDGKSGPGLSDSGRDLSLSFSMDGPSMIGNVVPRGLQSFEEDDADFFLQLLPGAVDRTGLPPVVRFWKNRIEETDPSKLLRVGLLYGPSGCGKSSVIRAGLIPRLSPEVVPVTVVATATETEARLIEQIRERFPEAEQCNDLAETLLAVRRADIAEGRRLLIVIDQFEQWLQAHTDDDNAEFVRAMRQCDGLRVQTLLLVRDEFWMSVIGFLRQLDITLEEGRNSKAVDLFEVPHARKVLTAFGRAYEALPPAPAALEEEQTRFIEAAVDELAEDGRVVPVRLALFAEMMRRREWTPDSLQKLGGAEGVGIAFLDECFRSDQAPPEYRLHRQAAREILGSLLPVAGTQIRRHRKKIQDLVAASGYEEDSAEFQTVLRILCEDLRLLSTVDPLGADGKPAEARKSTDLLYELTHDYLVPALRTWLERERRETTRGRTQILLERRSDFWNARPERKQLPTMMETLRIWFLTKSEHWSEAQTKMMRSARRVHGIRATIAGGILVGLSFVAVATTDYLATQAAIRETDAHIGRLLVADPNRIMQEATAVPADPEHWSKRLREIASDETGDLSDLIRTWLALLPEDQSVAVSLAGTLDRMTIDEHAIVVDSLVKLDDPPVAVIEQHLNARDLELTSQLKFAGALARLKSNSAVWARAAEPVAEALLEADTGEVDYWTQTLSSVRESLQPHLERRFDDQQSSPAMRQFSSTILAMLLRDEPEKLVALAVRSDSTQMRELVNALQAHPSAGIEALRVIEEPLLKEQPVSESALKTLLATSVIRFQLNDRSPLFSRLEMSPDPTLRSSLLLQLQEFGIPLRTLREQLAVEERPSCRQALLLAIGEYSPKSMSDEDRASVVADVLSIVKSQETSPGTHAAGVSLLRRWDASIPEIDPVAFDQIDRRKWWRDSNGHTMLRVPAAKSFLMGSPVGEEGRTPELEGQRQMPLPHELAVSSCEVSVAQIRQFLPWFEVDGRVCPNDDCPVTKCSWLDAIRYCRWLSEQEGMKEEDMVYPSIEDLDLEAIQKGEAEPPKELLDLPPERLARTGYRLPTSVEWEYLCRAGSQSQYYFGHSDAVAPKFAWTTSSPGAGTRTLEVGSLLPNAWGLFNTAGNVAEWTHDGPLDESETGEGVELGSIYLRGGNYRAILRAGRSARLASLPPRTRYSYTGFRVVRTVSRSD